MTKTKNATKGRPDRASSGNANTTEATSTAKVTADGDHQAERQSCQEVVADDFEMAIRELAYHKWEAAGFPEGDGFDFWLEAEREVRANQQASGPAQT